ncbi:hypothetical protein EDC55_11612 [Allofrancisella inopinata]|uniref:Lipoprotein n=1 Tax=Allofrancisella inopinata TaxID=1085647 RepID=A0AAE6YIJ3_9GAMM|nr:hypothetical protein [Allofrancisella inopinata]QIV96082.1 hypothetical protein E4K63_04270 [Allofrancisella inopinata]TDT69672.1 hypothetical protein EDC55_11612 [Allofrancisella inopinata]
MKKAILKKVMATNVTHTRTKMSIIFLVLVGCTQTVLATDNIQKITNNDPLSKCKMKGNVVIKSDSATVYTDENNETVVLLPKSDKKHPVLLESDSQECTTASS